jgi:threonyl-tRNA synthetase
MAQAVKELFPEAKLTVGPPLADRFYYDIDMPPVGEEEFARIEDKMREIAARDLPIVREEVSRDEARALFQSLGEDYKIEILEELPADEPITLYRQGDWVDLCRGPHLPSTGKIKSFKILASSGAFWRGDANNKQLQRLYGTSYPSQKELDQHLQRLEEAKARDHRKLGRELGLFILSSDVGAGLPLWLPKGAALRRVLEDFIRDELVKRGYQPVYTPHIANAELFRTSGHLTAYADSMFPLMKSADGDEFALKPVNCPFHAMIYKSEKRSYRDPNKPEKYVGSDDAWQASQSALLAAVQDLGLEHTVEEGEAAIYGPKLDFVVNDAIGRQWQLGTVQVDYVLPERFDLEYTGSDGHAHRPVMIHRAPFGSLERFCGVLIEHFAGAFPLWLAPVQVVIAPIADRHNEAATSLKRDLEAAGFRVEADLNNEKVGAKIGKAEAQKVPYMAVIGDREAESGGASLRARGRQDLGAMSREELIAKLVAERDV